MRIFLALDISSSDKKMIEQWRSHNISAPFKTTSTDNLHITLSFLGSINSQQLDDVVKYIDAQIKVSDVLPPTRLIFNTLGRFIKPKVLYLGLSNTPPWLFTLAKHLKEKALALDIFQEERKYCPHLTLYRKANYLPIVNDFALCITISSFSLYLSDSTPEGVTYTPLKTWPIYSNTTNH